MNQHDFESRVLSLWMTTRVPLTRANLQFYTHAPRKKIERWLDAMVSEHVLDVDSDDDGELLWLVRGAARPATGPARIEDVARLEELSAEVGSKGAGMVRRRASLLATRGLAGQALAREGGEKSVVASGALSLFLGPLGWIYAGPLREAIPAGLLFWFVLLPVVRWFPFVGYPLASLLYLASVLAGMTYAWQYNRTGHVTPLLGDESAPRLPGRRPR